MIKLTEVYGRLLEIDVEEPSSTPPNVGRWRGTEQEAIKWVKTALEKGELLDEPENIKWHVGNDTLNIPPSNGYTWDLSEDDIERARLTMGGRYWGGGAFVETQIREGWPVVTLVPHEAMFAGSDTFATDDDGTVQGLKGGGLGLKNKKIDPWSIESEHAAFWLHWIKPETYKKLLDAKGLRYSRLAV